jgi:aldehyde dehydrogenase (NAD+)
VLPLIAAGNTVVAVPSESYPLITGDLYQVFETSDLPGGVVNIVAGRATELLKVLAKHDDLDGIWCYGDAEMCASAKALSVGNLKQVWTNEGRHIDFFKHSAERRPLVSGACTSSEKHLGPIRRVSRRSSSTMPGS